MDSFEAMYNNLTLLLRENSDLTVISMEFQKLIETYPGMEIQLRQRVDAAFGDHPAYKTAKNIYEQGRTQLMTEIGNPTGGNLYPYSDNRDLHYEKGNVR